MSVVHYRMFIFDKSWCGRDGPWSPVAERVTCPDCENGPLALSEKRRRVRWTRRPGGPFRSETGGAQCSLGTIEDYEDDDGGPGYVGAESWFAWLRWDTKCVDPATEVAP